MLFKFVVTLVMTKMVYKALYMARVVNSFSVSMQQVNMAGLKLRQQHNYIDLQCFAVYFFKSRPVTIASERVCKI